MLRSFRLLSLLCGIFISFNCLLADSATAIMVQSDELSSLQRGRVVQKSLTPQLRRGLKGSESKVLIDAPARKVWDVIDKKENLPKFIRQVKNTEILEENKDTQKVSATVRICDLLPTFKYILLFDNSERYRKIKFRKTGGAFKELFGYFEMIPYGDKTIFAYRIYTDPGFYIPEFISKRLRGDATDIMLSIKREAEQ